MLAAEEPADVSEEQTPFDVVGVRVGFAKLVVEAVVSGPSDHGLLESEAVADHQEETEGPVGFVGVVGPQAVGAGGDAEESMLVHVFGWKKRDLLLLVLFTTNVPNNVEANLAEVNISHSPYNPPA